MPRSSRIHVGVIDSPTTTLKPKHLTNIEFGRRVYHLMLKKGWNQSELGRQSGLPRDSISTYIRGKSLPTAANLEALARALDVTPEELLPNHIEAAIDEDNPAFEMKVSVSAPGMAWLRVNRLVSTATAVKIAEMLQNDNAPNGSGGG